MIFKSVLGIHMGNTSCAVVWLKGTMTGFNLIDSAYGPLPGEEGVEARCESAAGLIKNFIRGRNMASTEIRMSISRDLIIMRRIQLPLAVRENLGDTLGYEMEKYIPLDPGDIVFDYQVVSTDKSKGQMTVLLGAVKKEDLSPFVGLSESLNLGLVSLEAGSSGLAALLNDYSGHRGKEFAFLHLDGWGADMGVVSGNLLVASHYHPLDSSSPEKKIQFPCREAVSFYAGNGLSNDIPLLVCGPGSPIDLMDDLAGQEPLNPALFSAKDHGIPDDTCLEAMGLALAGVGNRPVSINFLPEEQRKKVGRTAYRIMVILSVLVLLTGLTWAGGSVVHKHMVQRKVDAELGKLRGEVVELQAMVRDIERAEARVDGFNALRNKKLLLIDVLLEITRLLPKDAWVEEFSHAKDKYRIEGYAESASDLLTRLEKSQTFKNVTFLSAITRRYDKERFRIGFETE